MHWKLGKGTVADGRPVLSGSQATRQPLRLRLAPKVVARKGCPLSPERPTSSTQRPAYEPPPRPR